MNIKLETTKLNFEDFLSTRVLKRENKRKDCYFVFLTHEGLVYTYGNNSQGQLGLGDFIDRLAPVDNDVPNQVLGLTNIIDIRANTHETYCIDNIGRVFAFGENNNGQLGLGNTKNKTTPHLIEALLDYQIILVKTNACVAYFLDRHGNVYACGKFNDTASTGLGKSLTPYTLPKKINALPPVQTIFPSNDHVFFLTSVGEVYGCGDNYSGQLGIGHRGRQFLPVKLELPSIHKISGSTFLSYFLSRDGRVFAAGRNKANQISSGVKEKIETNCLILEIDHDIHTFELQKIATKSAYIYSNPQNTMYYYHQETGALKKVECDDLCLYNLWGYDNPILRFSNKQKMATPEELELIASSILFLTPVQLTNIDEPINKMSIKEYYCIFATDQGHAFVHYNNPLEYCNSDLSIPIEVKKIYGHAELHAPWIKFLPKSPMAIECQTKLPFKKNWQLHNQLLLKYQEKLEFIQLIKQNDSKKRKDPLSLKLLSTLSFLIKKAPRLQLPQDIEEYINKVEEIQSLNTPL